MRCWKRSAGSQADSRAAGFVLLLLLIGLGLHELIAHWPFFTRAIQWIGGVFLLVVAYRLAMDDGRLGDADQSGHALIRVV
ncbi:MAG TPA: hypothetical protein VL689_11565 [Paraburkholderia sp.]|jgi:threonine/homoserine/homoserine lactone efflux protein|nr:hypothetical protein [Paraburkholderia sp.]